MNRPSAPVAAPSSGERRPTRAEVWAFGVLLAVALFAVLFPWFPGLRDLAVGATVDRTILAPRDVAFESVVRTEDVREEAASAVEDIYIHDPGVRDRQMATLTRIITAIDQHRRNATLSDSARETAIRSVSGVSLTPDVAATLAEAPPDRYQAVSDQAMSALGRTLTGAVSDADVEAMQERAVGFVTSLPEDETEAVGELIAPLVVPTLAVAVQRTETLRDEARANTPPVQVIVREGDMVVPAGTQLTAADIETLAQLGIRDGAIRLPVVGATAAFAALLAAAMTAHLGVGRPAVLHGRRRMVLYALLLLVPVAVLKFTLPLLLHDADRQFLAYAVPIAAAPIAAAILIEVPTGVLLATLLAAVAGFVSVYIPGYGVPGELAQIETARLMLSTGAASLAGVYVAARAHWVQRYLFAGLAAAAASAAVLVLLLVLDPEWRTADLAWIAISTSGAGLSAALLTIGAFFLLSHPFGIVTRVELMEHAQLDRPLLRRLQDEAPGTFQHSVIVGNLAERAADRIGADALLTRVGAYYHDIGKLVAPGFFVENLAGAESPHQHLDPLQSTRVIHQHVTAGIELARRERLPEPIAQFIPEHHGTRLAPFFYRMAADEDPDISPELFRYPGPKPQSRETALVMLADASEASVRASSARSPEAIRNVVEEIVRERIQEAQFDECDISLRDLRVTVDSFVTALSAVYHPRVEYPEPTRRELAARGNAPPPEPPPLASPPRPVIAERLDDDMLPPAAGDPATARRVEIERPPLSEDTT